MAMFVRYLLPVRLKLSVVEKIVLYTIKSTHGVRQKP